jgi:hypothetical protein
VRETVKLALAFLLSASMWMYVDRVLVPHQKAEAAIHGIPRGNLSDLYPSWLATRELLLHGRDPYSPEITREIQSGYFGRPLDPSRKDDPTNQQAFAYPVYVAFLLAPTIKLPFSYVQLIFRCSLAGLIVLSVLLWLRALRWRPSWRTTAVFIVLTLGTFPAVQGIKLQQLSLVVSALVAGGIALLVWDQLIFAGILIALSTIKPQLTVPLLAWLLLWAIGNLRSRWKFAASLLVTLAALILSAEFLMSGWMREFYYAVLAYRKYAAGPSLLQQSLTPTPGVVLSLLIVIAVALACWSSRKCSASDRQFVWTTSLVLATTLLIIPVFAPHYQLLLLPGTLLLVHRWDQLSKSNLAIRVLLGLAAISLIWPWVSAAALTAASFFTPAAQHFWQLPLWTTPAIPVTIASCLAAIGIARIEYIEEDGG